MHVGVRAFELNARLTRFVKTRRALELVTFVASSSTNARATIETNKTNFVRRFNPLPMRGSRIKSYRNRYILWTMARQRRPSSQIFSFNSPRQRSWLCVVEILV